MPKTANRVSLGAVHTHTHTHTCISREIRRVANGATLYCVEDSFFVALYEVKNKVLEIACFLLCHFESFIYKFLSTNLLKIKQLQIVKQGGVE